LKILEEGFKRFEPATAYILINCEIGCETVVIDELRLLPQVMEAAEIYGSSYDIIAKVTAQTDSKLKEIIRNDIRRIGRVKATQTMMVVIRT
jgi:DNA-binding Lrp family transcriptional regulator